MKGNFRINNYLCSLSITKTSKMLEQLTAHLSQFMMQERYNQMIKVLNERTEYIVPVLENIYQPQNANAVVRTSECLGFQRLCVIENTHVFQVHRDICMGSTKWLDIEKFSGKPTVSLNSKAKVTESLPLRPTKTAKIWKILTFQKANARYFSERKNSV